MLAQLATQVVGSLLALEALDEDAEVRVFINSPGGTPYSVIGVVDAMQVRVPCWHDVLPGTRFHDDDDDDTVQTGDSSKSATTPGWQGSSHVPEPVAMCYAMYAVVCVCFVLPVPGMVAIALKWLCEHMYSLPPHARCMYTYLAGCQVPHSNCCPGRVLQLLKSAAGACSAAAAGPGAAGCCCHQWQMCSRCCSFSVALQWSVQPVPCVRHSPSSTHSSSLYTPPSTHAGCHCSKHPGYPHPTPNTGCWDPWKALQHEEHAHHDDAAHG